MSHEEREHRSAPVLTVREACRRRVPLDGTDAQMLEHALTITERERDAALAEVARMRPVVEAAEELLEVAALRGDNELPHPCDDPKLWTARMQTAWHEAQSAVDAYRAEVQP